jgi:hypothetical protein
MSNPAPATVTTSELKAGAPFQFNGDPLQARRFLFSVKTYFIMNPTVYNTDVRQIGLALAYMNEGTASTWAQTFYQDAFTSSPPKFGKWDDFEKAFKEAFSSPDQAGEALSKLRDLKQGSGPLVKYVSAFKALVSQASIKESVVLIEWFCRGLNYGLVTSIYRMENVPTDFDKFVTAAMKMDANWRQGASHRNHAQKNKKGNSNTKYVPRPSASRRDPDAMDVDRTLSPSEKDKAFREGRCFKCNEKGHRANRCPAKVRKTEKEESKKGKKPVRHAEEQSDDEESDNQDSDDEEDMDVQLTRVIHIKKTSTKAKTDGRTPIGKKDF